MTPDHLRVSDAERDAVIAQLQRHAGEGRLTLDEFGERVDEIARARTGAELRAVLRELPPLAPPAPPAARRMHGARVPPLLILVALLVGVSLAVGHFVVWPLFIFAFCGFGRFGRRHRYHADEPEEPVTVA